MSQKDLIDRIRNLRAKAGNAASTEAEARAAADAAARLIAKHEISEEELREAENDSSSVDREASDTGRSRVCPSVQLALEGIFLFTQVDGYLETLWRSTRVVVVGLEADRLMALYLIELTQCAAQRAWSRYRRSLGWEGCGPIRGERRVRDSFKSAFGAGLTMKLKELAEAREIQQRTTGTDIAIRKDAMIREKMPENLGDAPANPLNRKDLCLRAASAGMLEGKKVDVQRPLADSKDRAARKGIAAS